MRGSYAIARVDGRLVEVDGIAFDAFGTLFDLGDLEEPFKQRVIPWTWYATASGRFRPLPEIVAAIGIDPQRVQSLPAYDDVAPGLDALREHDLAVLSNGTHDGVERLVDGAGLPPPLAAPPGPHPVRP